MSLGTAFSAAGTGLGMATSIAGGFFAFKNAKRQARELFRQAQEEERAGGAEAGQIGREVRQVLGLQKATAAAQGFDISTGDPVAILLSTAQLGAEDQAAVERRGQVGASRYRSAAIDTLLAGTEALTGGVIGAAGYGLSSIPGFLRMPGKPSGSGWKMSYHVPRGIGGFRFF